MGNCWESTEPVATQKVQVQSKTAAIYESKETANEDEDDVEINSNGLTSEYQNFQLQQKTQYNHNTYIFRFSLQSATSTLNLPIGHHLMLRIDDPKLSDFPISRPYTPITNNQEVGYFDLLIKIYDDGEFTQILHKIRVNDFVQAKGPMGRISYLSGSESESGSESSARAGACSIRVMTGVKQFFDLECQHLNMIAGGTGITPLYQILRFIHQNRETAQDTTEISLIFANKTTNDVLLKQELLEMQSDPLIRIYFTVTQLSADDESDSEWQFGVGRVNQEMLAEHLFPPSDTCVSMFCGPNGFNKCVKKALKAIGYADDRALRF